MKTDDAVSISSCCPYLYFGSPTYFSSVDHLSGKVLFIRFTTRASRKLLSVYVFCYFPFGFEGRVWGLIVSVPDHCFPDHCLYFTLERYRLEINLLSAVI